ncbi:glycosyl-transferase for dystroglycan-domain-containing protein [Spinellus fusiger]|nr:glycosyl-transferase for dystroglycan-domain-containing protein [Spinellus fusiger]
MKDYSYQKFVFERPGILLEIQFSPSSVRLRDHQNLSSESSGDKTNIESHKLGKIVLVVYAFVSILYAVHYFYLSNKNSSSIANEIPILPTVGLSEEKVSREAHQKQKNKVDWLGGQDVVQSTPESFIMSKVFSDAMGPSDIKPYFHQASTVFEKEDITMSTIVTRDRFPVLSRLASHYKGPISAAVHINDDDDMENVLDELYETIKENEDIRTYVDIHLIVDTFDRQFNLWRNVAKLFAQTDYIMMLDVDFHLCTDFRNRIKLDPTIMDMLRTGTTALVVPAFEFTAQEDGLDWQTFPTSKEELMEEVDSGRLDMFHKAWLKGHGSTNYTQWYTSNRLYKVQKYDFSYEPYIIYKKEGSPWCDERFIGYGANKAACLYEIYLSGINYWVLPQDFLIHQTHDYPEETRKKERQYNRKLYSNFREELCLRYSRMFVATNEWDTERANNLKGECQKIRSFSSTLKMSS